MNRAGFFVRLAAALLDGLFCVVPTAVVVGMLEYHLWSHLRWPERAVDYVGQAVLYFVILCYFLTEVVSARSPGKRVLRLRITRSDGSVADGWALFSRWLTKFGPWVVYLIAVLTLWPSPLMALAGFMQLVIVVGCFAVLGEQKRSFHDRWSGTAVYRLPPREVARHGFEVVGPPPLSTPPAEGADA
jgi:uncharacterized RDD family membrane protein YckC